MNPQTATRRWAERLGRASRQQVGLRVLALVAGSAWIPLCLAAGGDVHLLLSLALVTLVVAAALVPDSAAPMFAVLALGGSWAVYVPETLSVWTLVAAGDLLVLHLACTLASYGPPQLVLGPAMLRLWCGRGLALLAGTAVAWVAARVLDGLGPAPSGLLTVAALAVVLGWTVVLSARLLARDAAEPSEHT
jgi:hypothetical protein